MDTLLDLVTKTISTSQNPTPNFPLPLGDWFYCSHDPPDTNPSNGESPFMEKSILSNHDGGIGWYAKTGIKAGTVLLVAKPLALVMDWEVPDEDEDDDEDDDDDEEDDDDEDNNDDVEEESNEEEKSTNSSEIHSAKTNHEWKGVTSSAMICDDAEHSETLDQNETDYCQDDDTEDESNQSMNTSTVEYSSRIGLLILRLLDKMKKDPTLWFHKVSKLHPRFDMDKSTSPTWSLWICSDPTMGLQIDQSIQEFSQQISCSETYATELQYRIPMIVRYNCLSMETSPELLSYPDPQMGGLIQLAGTGLFYQPSFFNHHYKPNVARWSVGDIMVFVTNQDIPCGRQLCISYLESEYLCENAEIRTALLDMDFVDHTDDLQDDTLNTTTPKTTTRSSMAPTTKLRKIQSMIDIPTQQEILDLNPLERIHIIQDLMQQGIDALQERNNQNHSYALDPSFKNTEDGDSQMTTPKIWFQCDVYQLQILLAITLESLGQADQALIQWEKCIQFTDNNLPPVDEQCIVIKVQASICALSLGKKDRAKSYAELALQQHDLIFGGGVARFRKRYSQEVGLPIRSKLKWTPLEILDTLWPNTDPIKRNE